MVAQRSVSMSNMAPNLVAESKSSSSNKLSECFPSDGEQVLTLVQSPGGVAVEGIQQTAEQVTEDGRPRTAGHQVEGEQGQNNTGITCRNPIQ